VLSELGLYLLAILLSAGLTLGTGTVALGWLRAHGCQQYIREEGPQRHLEKAGTPTLGGLTFLPVALAAGLLLPLAAGKWHSFLLPLAGLTLGFMLVGLADDILMLRRRNNLGLKARHKLLLQFLLAGLFLYALSRGPHHTILQLPFSLRPLLLPPWGYFCFAALLIVGTSNSTNLSDGLDGLLAGLAAIAAAAFALLSHWTGRSELVLFCCALLGACLGFLFYNHYPARLFMGDTGSLALGAALSGLAVLLRAELLLFFLGAIFFLESLSVIIQVVVFKRTRRRVFRMSPLHHHFELSGWKETRVVKAFWAWAAAITAAALSGTYIGWGLRW